MNALLHDEGWIRLGGPDIERWEAPLAWMKRAIATWSPSACTFGPYWHSDHKVLEDRPGVGWMLYLPENIANAIEIRLADQDLLPRYADL